MFVYRQTPEEVFRVVHETWYNHSKHGGGGVEGDDGGRSYLRVELIDLLNGSLNIPSVDCSTNLNSFLNRLDVCPGLDVGLDRKFLRSRRIAIGDEVVHDQVVYIPSRTTVSS